MMQKLLGDYDKDIDPESIEKQVTDTSKEAYHNLMQHPLEVRGRYNEYLSALKEIGHPATDYEVTKYLGKNDPNYVRPRRYELEGKDIRKKDFMETPLIHVVGKRKCKITRRNVYIYWFTQLGKQIVDNGGISS